jgi:hypothetical protein
MIKKKNTADNITTEQKNTERNDTKKRRKISKKIPKNNKNRKPIKEIPKNKKRTKQGTYNL